MVALKIKIKKIDERAVMPKYAHVGDVGMDLTAISCEYDEEHDMYIYHTGLAFESDFNIGQFLFARSSNSKTDCYLTNGVGIADSAIYRGEIQFRFKNRDSLMTMARIDALSQLVKMRVPQYLPSYFDEFMKTTEEQFLERARNLEFAPYSVGDRIGQMVFMEYPTVELELVDELSTTERGTRGFGSTGK